MCALRTAAKRPGYLRVCTHCKIESSEPIQTAMGRSYWDFGMGMALADLFFAHFLVVSSFSGSTCKYSVHTFLSTSY